MSETTGLTHADPRQAETAAADKIAPHLKKIKQGILTWAANAQEHGVTPDEFSRETGGLINTVRRRFTDLWKEGKMRPTELTRPNARGNPETVWVLGRDEAGMARRETSAQKISRLEAKMLNMRVAGDAIVKRLWHHAENAYTHAENAQECGCLTHCAARDWQRFK